MLTLDQIKPGVLAYFAPQRLAEALHFDRPLIGRDRVPRPFVCLYSNRIGCGWTSLSTKPGYGRLVVDRAWFRNAGGRLDASRSYAAGDLYYGHPSRFVLASELTDELDADSRPWITAEGIAELMRYQAARDAGVAV